MDRGLVDFVESDLDIPLAAQLCLKSYEKRHNCQSSSFMIIYVRTPQIRVYEDIPDFMLH